MKKLLQQALDALSTSTPEPRKGDDDYCRTGWKEHADAISALHAAIAQGESEPVKYEYRWIGGGDDWADVEDSSLTLDELKAIPTKCEVRALYAAPVQPDHAPLTDPQIYAIAKQHPRIATLVPHLEAGEFARAIERAVRGGL